jgi:hypothetical protein
MEMGLESCVVFLGREEKCIQNVIVDTEGRDHLAD